MKSNIYYKLSLTFLSSTLAFFPFQSFAQESDGLETQEFTIKPAPEIKSEFICVHYNQGLISYKPAGFPNPDIKGEIENLKKDGESSVEYQAFHFTSASHLKPEDFYNIVKAECNKRNNEKETYVQYVEYLEDYNRVLPIKIDDNLMPGVALGYTTSEQSSKDKRDGYINTLSYKGLNNNLVIARSAKYGRKIHIDFLKNHPFGWGVYIFSFDDYISGEKIRLNPAEDLMFTDEGRLYIEKRFLVGNRN